MKTYLIKKGNHYSGIHFGLNLKNSLTRILTFTESCKYIFSTEYASDINKCYGFSNGYHMQNSARIGWRYNQATGLIDLLCFMQIDGEMIMDYNQNISLMSVPINTPIRTSIRVVGKQYIFTATLGLNTIVKTFSIGNTFVRFGYFLYPYFGGTQVAPDNITIEFDKILGI